MARRTVIGTSVLLITLATRAYAQDCVGVQPASVFFANGINTATDDAARAQLNELAVTLDRIGTIPSRCLEGDTAYNRNEFFILDLFEAYEQVFSSGVAGFLRFLSGIDVAPDWFQQEFADVARQIDTGQYVTDVDLQRHIGKYRAALDSGRKVIVVAHSQGNLYANEAYRLLTGSANPTPPERVSIVAIATPAAFVADASEHITLYGDIIQVVPFSLLANTDNAGTACYPPVFGVYLLTMACHGFVESYLTGADSEVKIIGSLEARVPRTPPSEVVLPNTPCDGAARPVSFGSLTSPMVRESGVSAFRYGSDNLSFVESTPTEITFRLNLLFPPPSTTLIKLLAFDVNCNAVFGFGPVSASEPNPPPVAGLNTVIFNKQSAATSFNGGPFSLNFPQSAIRYVWTEVWDGVVNSSRASYSYLVDVQNPVNPVPLGSTPPNRPPTGAFTMSVTGQAIPNGGTLNVVADAATGEGRVTFVDASSDPDGQSDIVSRVWRVNTRPEPLSIGDLTFGWGFTPGGPYVVTLTVTDRAGLTSEALATINVGPPTFVPTLFYDRGESFTSFGQPVVDSQGNVLAVRSLFGAGCGFGFCEMRLDSIDPSGSLNWETPAVAGGDSIAAKALFLGPNDLAHVLGRTQISAFAPDSHVPAGWPAQIQPPFNFNWTFTGIALDHASGSVFSSLGVFGACFNSCDKVVTATNSDGSTAWRLLYPGDGTAYGLVGGPAGRVFTITGSVPFASIVGIDTTLGVEVCRSEAASYYGSLVGGSGGAFTAYRGTIAAFDGNCQGRTVYASDTHDVQLRGYASGHVLGIEYPENSSNPNDAQLLGVAMDGASLWRNDGIVVNLNQNPIRASTASTLYVAGLDRSDGNRRKVFLVDSNTGQVTGRIPTEGICADQCGVAVAPDGTIYISDLDSSTRIFRVQR